jgi:hypothetical protein
MGLEKAETSAAVPAAADTATFSTVRRVDRDAA